MHCPVCPSDSLDGTEARCPQCGTDLSALRRVLQLPRLLLETGEELVEREPAAAVSFLSVAALAEPTRARALLRLGEAHARLGNAPAARACWEAVAGTPPDRDPGTAEEARARLADLAAQPLVAVLLGLATTRLARLAGRAVATGR